MKAILFDVDGTLVESVYFFVETYHKAYKEFGVYIPKAVIHKVVGMGCDKAIPRLTSPEWNKRNGQALQEKAYEIFLSEYLHNVELFPCSEQLCESLKSLGFSLALASSSSSEIIDHYLSLFNNKNLFDYINTSCREHIPTKPDPDIFLDIISQGDFDPECSFVVGDSVWDALSARAGSLPFIGVLTGGYTAEELRSSGACEIYADVGELHRKLDSSMIMKNDP